MLVDTWVTDMEHQFRHLGVHDTYIMARVAPVTFQKEASVWWKGQLAILGDIELSWTEFKIVFLENYFSDMAREKMRDRFAKLQQGDDSVAEYARKYISYSRFASNLVVDEAQKVGKFIMGLKPRTYVSFWDEAT